MEPQTHPSFLALDRYAVAGVAPGELARHVEHCERCRAHLERMRQPLPLPLPRWASERCAFPARGFALAGWLGGLPAHSPRGRGARWFWAGGTGLAFALVALLVTRSGVVRPDAVYIGARGTAAVGLYVKRGQRVFLWDGQERVRAGDRLRLKVVPEGFTQVGVFTQDADGVVRAPLFAGPLAKDEEVLPPAWTVDATPGAEVLIVVLAHGLPAGELRACAQAGATPGRPDVWVRRFSLEKTTGDANAPREAL